MARLPRQVVAGQPVHLIQRGNNRVATFVAPRDFAIYRDMLGEASLRARCAIHAYVLMTNHLHLLATPEDEHGPSRLMQILGRRYVRYFNTRHARTGTLWEGRFRSGIIDSERYFFACSRYIELNPVRARLAQDPSEFPWSSSRCNAQGALDSVVTPHPLYTALATTPTARQEAYRFLFHAPLETEMVDDIRRATNAGKIIGPMDERATPAGSIECRMDLLVAG